MLISSGRAEFGCIDACLVVVANGRRVEAYVVHDRGNRVEHVADWQLDGLVVAVNVAPVKHGFLVTSASDVGVGWSWVNSTSWTVASTCYEDINISGYKTAEAFVDRTSASALASEATSSSSSSSSTLLLPVQGSACYLPTATAAGGGVCIITLKHHIFMTCRVHEFNQQIWIVTSICLASSLGMPYISSATPATSSVNHATASNNRGKLPAAAAIRGSIPFSQIQLEQGGGLGGAAHMNSSSNVSDSMMPASFSSSGNCSATNSKSLGWTVNRGGNDPYVCFIRQEIISDGDGGGDDDGGSCSILLECLHLQIGYKSLRWCELELEAEMDDKAATTDVRGKGGILRVLWEMALPQGANWCTEPYNNDGVDSRKLVYMLLPHMVVRVYNINGLVCEFVPKMNANGSELAAASYGTPVGFMISRLPLTDERRRLLVVSSSSGAYLCLQLNDVRCVDGKDSAIRRPLLWRVLSATKPLAEQSYNGHVFVLPSLLASTPMLLVAQVLLPISAAEDENALVLKDNMNMISFLGYHSSFGIQLLSAEIGYIDADIGISTGTGTGTGTGKGTGKGNWGVAQGGERNILQSVIPTAAAILPFSVGNCFSSSALTRLTNVERISVVRNAFHNAQVPDRIISICSTDDTNPSSQNHHPLQSIVYTCEYGAAVAVHAEAELDIDPELVSGFRLFGVSYAAVWSVGPYNYSPSKVAPMSNLQKQDKDNKSPMSSSLSSNARIWPILLSSRVLKQTGLLAVDVSSNQVCSDGDVPAYMKIRSDASTIALLPLGSNSSGIAVQITPDSFTLLYLEEHPNSIKQFNHPLKLEVTLEMLGLKYAPEPPFLPQESSIYDNQYQYQNSHGQCQGKGIGEDEEFDCYSSDSDKEDDLSAEIAKIKIALLKSQPEASPTDITDSPVTGTNIRVSGGEAGDYFNGIETAPILGKVDESTSRTIALMQQQLQCLESRAIKRSEKYSLLLTRERQILEHRRQYLHEKHILNTPDPKLCTWSVEYAASLGTSFIIAGRAYLVVIQFLQSNNDKNKLVMNMDNKGGCLTPVTVAAPLGGSSTTPGVPVSPRGRRQGTITTSKVSIEQIPYVVYSKQRLLAPISALGTLQYGNHNVVAVGYSSVREVQLWSIPSTSMKTKSHDQQQEEKEELVDMSLQASFLLPDTSASTATSTSTSHNENSEGCTEMNAVRHLVLMPLGTGLVSEGDVMSQKWNVRDIHSQSNATDKADTATASTAAAVDDSDEEDDLLPQPTVKSSEVCTAVAALVAALEDGSIFVYYIYMRENGDSNSPGPRTGTGTWKVALYQRFHCPKRIISATALDTRVNNMVTEPNQSKDKNKKNDSRPLGSAVLLHTSDGQYILHFAAGTRPEECLLSSNSSHNNHSHSDGNSNEQRKTDVPVNIIDLEHHAATAATDTPNIGSLHTDEELAVNCSCGPYFKTHISNANDKQQQSISSSSYTRVQSIRASLLSEEEKRDGVHAFYGPHAAPCARQHWLPKHLQHHVWTWLPLLATEAHSTTSTNSTTSSKSSSVNVSMNKNMDSTMLQIPGCGAGGGYRNIHSGGSATRQLLSALGLMWLTTVTTEDEVASNASNSHSNSSDSGKTSKSKSAPSSIISAATAAAAFTATTTKPVTTQTVSVLLCVGAPQDDVPRFHTMRRICIPGTVQDMRTTADSKRIFFIWNRKSRSSSSSSTGNVLTSSMQGMAVLDATTLKCLWRTEYPAFPAFPQDTAAVLPISAAPVSAPAPVPVQEAIISSALSSTASARLAAKKLQKELLEHSKLIHVATEQALENLATTAGFSVNPTTGHRQVRAILDGLPPLLALSNMLYTTRHHRGMKTKGRGLSLSMSISQESEYVTLLHDVTLNITDYIPVPVPSTAASLVADSTSASEVSLSHQFPATVPCILVSVYSLQCVRTGTTGKHDENSQGDNGDNYNYAAAAAAADDDDDDDTEEDSTSTFSSSTGLGASALELRAIGSVGYACTGVVVSAILDMTKSEREQKHLKARQKPRYVIMACDNDISIIGWKAKAGTVEQSTAFSTAAAAKVPNATMPSRSDFSGMSKSTSPTLMQLACLQSIAHTWGTVLEIRIGAISANPKCICKVFVTHIAMSSSTSTFVSTANSNLTNTNIHGTHNLASQGQAQGQGRGITIEILNVSYDSMNRPVLSIERTFSPTYTPSFAPTSTNMNINIASVLRHMSISPLFYSRRGATIGTGTATYTGIGQSKSKLKSKPNNSSKLIPEQCMSVSAIDIIQGTMQHVKFTMPEQRIYGGMSVNDHSSGNGNVEIMEKEALIALQSFLSFQHSVNGMYSTVTTTTTSLLPDNIAAHDILLHRTAGIVTSRSGGDVGMGYSNRLQLHHQEKEKEQQLGEEKDKDKDNDNDNDNDIDKGKDETVVVNSPLVGVLHVLLDTNLMFHVSIQ